MSVLFYALAFALFCTLLGNAYTLVRLIHRDREECADDADCFCPQCEALWNAILQNADVRTYDANDTPPVIRSPSLPIVAHKQSSHE
jgi:hypothetical protein